VFAVDPAPTNWRGNCARTRVTVLEQTSARILTEAEIDAPCTWVVCDASFIGLSKVLEVPLRLAAPQCRLVALIKPQFEVGRGEVGKGGVVRDPALHARVCEEVRVWVGLGFIVQGIVESPITGPEGNVEFLISAYRSAETGIEQVTEKQRVNRVSGLLTVRQVVLRNWLRFGTACFRAIAWALCARHKAHGHVARSCGAGN
jgi:hypothetical protein